MTWDIQHLRILLLRLWRFIARVVSHFRRNKGLLLAGAVAYNALLSIIPLFGLSLYGLSQFFDDEAILERIIVRELDLIVPGQSSALMGDITALMERPEWLGGVSLAVMLFFSSLAFRMLEDALAVIFKQTERKDKTRRQFWISAAIHYGYIFVVVLSITALSTLSAALEYMSWGDVTIFGMSWSLAQAPAVALYVSGLIGQVLMFSSIYIVMPVIDVPWRRALIGGITAACLWELTRHILLWYFANISLVSAVYGSLATVVVVLLTMEIAAVIILLGAQVISELEHSAQAGVRWYEEPPEEL